MAAVSYSVICVNDEGMSGQNLLQGLVFLRKDIIRAQQKFVLGPFQMQLSHLRSETSTSQPKC